MENKSDVRNMLHDALILFAITLIAGLVLGFVYELTKEPIRIQQEKAIAKACKEVFAQAESFEPLEYTISEDLAAELAADGVSTGAAYEALDSVGIRLGYVIQATSSEGYGGDITLYLGVTNDGTLNGISILEIAETPGLGMRADEVLTPQFQNKEVTEFTYTKSGSLANNEIDAISGATVTTEALIDAVNGGQKVILNALMTVTGAEEGGTANE